MNFQMLFAMHLCCALAGAVEAAEVPKAPVPQSPFIRVVYGYADAMLKHGRDEFGPKKTGLFLSAFDRTTMKPIEGFPKAPAGMRAQERAGTESAGLVGANPQHDQNLLRLLYTLSELTGKPHYRDAADAALKWFFENARTEPQRRLPWGEQISWDVLKDELLIAGEPGHRGDYFVRPWLLWDRCFRLAPESSQQFALGLKENPIVGPPSGIGAAGNSKHEAQNSEASLRQLGFYLRTWAAAYKHTGEEQFLDAITALLRRLEAQRRPRTGWIELWPEQPKFLPSANLSLAIDCDGAAHDVPDSFGSQLRAFARREDELFCSLPHAATLKSGKGFVSALSKATGKPAGAPTALWTARSGQATTAQVGMMCVARYDNSGLTSYRDLLLAAADAYLETLPGAEDDVWPGTLGQVISLELAAWRHSANRDYFDCARRLGELALDQFWGTNALPRASLQTAHYESRTGADTLALAMLELHLHVLHITAVRCPLNTIDR